MEHIERRRSTLLVKANISPVYTVMLSCNLTITPCAKKWIEGSEQNNPKTILCLSPLKIKVETHCNGKSVNFMSELN